MKYKQIKIERPEWCEIGTVVRLKGSDKERIITGAFQNSEGEIVFRLGCLTEWGNLWGNFANARVEAIEPVPAWEPKPGEYCAFFDDGEDDFIVVGRFSHERKGMYYRESSSVSSWQHVASIAGVDCACSIEELKARTDWL